MDQIYVFLFLFLSSVRCLLQDKFHYYELIREVSVERLSKRSITDSLLKQITVFAFDKNFTLYLGPSERLFSPQFRVTIIQSDGSKAELMNFPKENFYTGFVVGALTSSVALHVDTNKTVSGIFTADGEDYVLEPVSNLRDPTEDIGSEYAMIAYRRKDIKTDTSNMPLCGSVRPALNYSDPQLSATSSTARAKRATNVAYKTCKIVAVADYKYFQNTGKSNNFTTANYIVNIINNVNQIYRSTGFSLGNGYGFELDSLVIHNGPTNASSKSYAYNVQKTTWGTTELLEAFGRTTDYGRYCLAHLFTSQAMPDSVLGLAYIANPAQGSLGGICSPTSTYKGYPAIFNTGFSSSKNGAGSTVTLIQQFLVTAHELGHNWGSEHDPSSGSCAPGSILGNGKYIMYAYSVSGDDSNNNLFSSCSIASMNAVLNSKASTCFQASTLQTPCGNANIDSGEQCDGGYLGRLGQDQCCNSDCTLKTQAKCSSVNHPCCTNCQLASQAWQCQSDIEGSCLLVSYCDGVNLMCPQAQNKSDGTACLDGGSCLRGQCIAFCEFRNLSSCVCDAVATSCKRCCRNKITGQCSVFDNAVNLANGRSCVQGYCTSGVCVKVSTTMVARIWDFINNISIDTLVQSFKTNIVAYVTCFSLILYFPACIIIWCIDRKRRNMWEKENSIFIRKDRNLAHDEDRRSIVMPDQKSATSKPSTLDASDLLNFSYGHSSISGQEQPRRID